MSYIVKFIFFIILICGAFENAISQNFNLHTPFDAIRDLAEKAIESYEKGDRTEETLWLLQEAWLRGQDWLNSSEDENLMSQVVAGITTLRKELYDESDQELMLLILNSIVSTVTKDKNTFENIPDIYPDFKEIASDPQSILKITLDKMEKGEMKEAEKNLLILYYDTWYNGNNPQMKYQVANKLGLYYLRQQLPERCYDLLRSNKIEMEQKGILNKDYIENLVYMGFAELQKYTTPVIGHVFLEVATFLCGKYNIDPKEISQDYNKVMSTLNNDNGQISTFINTNDKNFYFLTERERIIRWNNIKEHWENLKTFYYEKDDKSKIDELLNAFQYEKQLLLRSAVKVKERLKQSKNPEITALVDSLLKIKMKMTTPMATGDKYESLEAEYQKIQKFLMHNEILSQYQDFLFTLITPEGLSSKLNHDETFIDFGKININGSEYYIAILFTDDRPQGVIRTLLPVQELKDFIKSTESEISKEMVRNRYENKYLYEKLWLPLVETGMIKDKIYYCPVGELNIISFDAIHNEEIFLGEKLEFHILSSADEIESVRSGEIYVPEFILSLCDIDYVGNRENLIGIAQQFGCQRPIKKHFLDIDEEKPVSIHLNTSFFPLHKKEEFEWLNNLDNRDNLNTSIISGQNANEYFFKGLSDYRGALNISTHAFNLPRGYNNINNFYVTSQYNRLVTVEPDTKDLLPLYRTGLFLSGGERSWTGKNVIDGIEDGIINGEEISSMDLSGLELVTLMACSTGNGEIDEYEGVLSIRRAFKMAGCKSMVTTAWNLDKEAALAYMKIFYTNLINGDGISGSHKKAQLELIKRFDDPYYWAVFQLID